MEAGTTTGEGATTAEFPPATTAAGATAETTTAAVFLQQGASYLADPQKVELLQGWEAFIDPKSGKTYYANRAKGISSWQVPEAPKRTSFLQGGGIEAVSASGASQNGFMGFAGNYPPTGVATATPGPFVFLQEAVTQGTLEHGICNCPCAQEKFEISVQADAIRDAEKAQDKEDETDEEAAKDAAVAQQEQDSLMQHPPVYDDPPPVPDHLNLGPPEQAYFLQLSKAEQASTHRRLAGMRKGQQVRS